MQIGQKQITDSIFPYESFVKILVLHGSHSYLEMKFLAYSMTIFNVFCRILCLPWRSAGTRF